MRISACCVLKFCWNKSKLVFVFVTSKLAAVRSQIPWCVWFPRGQCPQDRFRCLWPAHLVLRSAFQRKCLWSPSWKHPKQTLLRNPEGKQTAAWIHYATSIMNNNESAKAQGGLVDISGKWARRVFTLKNRASSFGPFGTAVPGRYLVNNLAPMGQDVRPCMNERQMHQNWVGMENFSLTFSHDPACLSRKGSSMTWKVGAASKNNDH